MGALVERWIIPGMVGFSPVILMLLNWAAGDKGKVDAAVPVIAAELFVIIVAVRHGLLSELRLKRHHPILLAAVLILAAVMVATALFVAPAPAAARIRTFIWGLHVLFALAVLHLSGRVLRSDDMVHCYLAGFLAFTLLLAVYVIRMSDPAGFDWTSGLPPVSHIRHLGYYAAAIVALCIGILALAQTRRRQVIAVAVAAVAFGLAFWSGSRGTIAAAVAGLVAGSLLVPAFRRPRVWLGTVVALLVAVAAIYPMPVLAPHMGFQRTVTATTGAQETGIATGRTDLWGRVLNAVQDRPLFGHGEGQMPAVAAFSTMVHPHNVVLQVLLAWGVVGGLCLLILAGAFAVPAVQAVRAGGGDLLPPFMAVLVLGAFSLFDGTLFHVLPVSIFAACIGLIAVGMRAPGGTEPE